MVEQQSHSLFWWDAFNITSFLCLQWVVVRICHIIHIFMWSNDCKKHETSIILTPLRWSRTIQWLQKCFLSSMVNIMSIFDWIERKSMIYLLLPSQVSSVNKARNNNGHSNFGKKTCIAINIMQYCGWFILCGFERWGGAISIRSDTAW